MKEECNGVYGNVDPRNTKCLEFVSEYHKVNALNLIMFLIILNMNINSNLLFLFNYLQCTDKINSHFILFPKCDDEKNTENILPDCYVSNVSFLHLVTIWTVGKKKQNINFLFSFNTKHKFSMKISKFNNDIYQNSSNNFTRLAQSV